MDHAALIAAIVACAAAVLVLGHRVVVQLMGRIDALSVSLRAEMQRQFDDSERHRAESAAGYRAAWDARHEGLLARVTEQAAEIAKLRREAEEERARAADAYVSRQTWLEHVGQMNIKLDRLVERLAPRETPPHGH